MTEAEVDQTGHLKNASFVSDIGTWDGLEDLRREAFLHIATDNSGDETGT